MTRTVLVFLLTLALIATAGCGTAGRAQDAPARYQALYAELDGELARAERQIAERWDGRRHGTNFAVELLVANGNRGPSLLKPQVMNGVKVTLDSLKALGVDAVTVAMTYPLLMPDFPRAAEYIAFFRQVVAEAQQRGIRVIAEMGPVFPDPEFSDFKADFTDMTLVKYMADKRHMAETIVGEIRPDYLVVAGEPLTLQRNTGLPMTVDNYLAVVRHTVAGLDKQDTRIGAGAGAWDNIAYFRGLAEIRELDYLDLHIYPVQRGFFVDKALAVKRLADAAGKGVTISEAWLYKAANKELTGVPGTEAAIFARDSFSFWQPLDKRFLTATANLSHLIKADYCSFFWMQYLYGNVDYSEALATAGPIRLKQAVNKAAAANIVAHRPNELGSHLQEVMGR